nr:hypothetical protein [Alistipes communis]
MHRGARPLHDGARPGDGPRDMARQAAQGARNDRRERRRLGGLRQDHGRRTAGRSDGCRPLHGAVDGRCRLGLRPQPLPRRSARRGGLHGQPHGLRGVGERRRTAVLGREIRLVGCQRLLRRCRQPAVGDLYRGEDLLFRRSRPSVRKTRRNSLSKLGVKRPVPSVRRISPIVQNRPPSVSSLGVTGPS